MTESNLTPLRDADYTPEVILRRCLDRAEACDLALVVTRTRDTQGWRVQWSGAFTEIELGFAALLVQRETLARMEEPHEDCP